MCKLKDMNDSTGNLVSSVVRSLAIAAVGLPLALGVSGSLGAITNFTDRAADQVGDVAAVQSLKNDLTKDCIYFMMSKDDSKLERASKDALDETFGEDGLNYGAVCGWVLND